MDLTGLFQTEEGENKGPGIRFCSHAYCPNVGVNARYPKSCSNSECKASKPRCVVCRENFTNDIDRVCVKCSQETVCVLCNTTGHSELYWVEDLHEHAGWMSPEGGFLCRKHFIDAYGPEERQETIINCANCKKPCHEHELDYAGFCPECINYSNYSNHSRKECLNILCKNTVEVDGEDHNFCSDCDKNIRAGICTNCNRKLFPSEPANMYGHCTDCSAGETEVINCFGCGNEKVYDPVGKEDPFLCDDCVHRVNEGKCTSCYEEATLVNQFGHCETCAPDLQSKCSMCDTNPVSHPRYTCAKCRLGVP